MSNWKPSCSIEMLKARAQLLADIRYFFTQREVLEVETPLLMEHGVTDRYMKSMRVPGVFATPGFLQTSPEYAMKRLLAADCGSIYQIAKAFRFEESGHKHNPEFSLLEWYRVDWDHFRLMDEVFELLSFVLNTDKRVDFSYQQVFERYLAINPFTIELAELKSVAQQLLGQLPEDLQFDDYLALLFEDKIEPLLGVSEQGNSVCFIYDYPASQASLARLNEDNPQFASRFEVYFSGAELANGFYELQDAEQQLQRFKDDNCWRKKQALEQIEIDHYLIDALKDGLPNCSGVALGIDRLLMLQQKVEDIKQVLAFPSVAY